MRATRLLCLTATAALAACGGTEAAAPPVPDSAGGLQQRFEQIVRTVSPRVVQIEGSLGLGSGVVFDADGNVVTNAHVVAGERHVVVTLMGGERHPGTVMGVDTAHDLAVVHLAGATPAPASFASPSSARVGDLVLAIGNPLGLRSSVTQGIVSAIDRSVPEGNGVTISSAIQTTAAINPGNSGGALVDLSGRVIGIPTLAALDPELGGEAAGIGFAIPSAMVTRVSAGLIDSAMVRQTAGP